MVSGNLWSRQADPVIVFDSYPDIPVTKDITHMRRSKEIMSPTDNFMENMPCRSKKEAFLGNPVNKQRLIDLLSSKLSENGARCQKAADDADIWLLKQL